jgi:hypothetical protein
VAIPVNPQFNSHSSDSYELCFCCHVSLKRGPAISEAHSDDNGVYATRADLPLFSRSTLRTLALRKEEAVAEAKQCIDRLLHS